MTISIARRSQIEARRRVDRNGFDCGYEAGFIEGVRWYRNMQYRKRSAEERTALTAPADGCEGCVSAIHGIPDTESCSCRDCSRRPHTDQYILAAPTTEGDT